MSLTDRQRERLGMIDQSIRQGQELFTRGPKPQADIDFLYDRLLRVIHVLLDEDEKFKPMEKSK